MADLYARDLIQSGDCTPACLLGSEEGSCVCRCGGSFHAALVDATVEGDAISWWDDCDKGGWTDALIEQHVPIVRAFSPAERALRARFREAGQIALYVEQHGKSYSVKVDSITCPRDLDWPEESRSIARSLLHSLLLKRRINSYSTPGDYMVVGPFRIAQEARVVCALLNEALFGNPDGCRRAVAVLSGQSDPVPA